MKKLLSFLAAGALAFGLIGCSGDLHDYEANEECIGLYLAGDVQKDKDNRGKLTFVDANTQTYKFTYDSTKHTYWGGAKGTINFKLVTDATTWTQDFGWKKDTPVFLSLNDDFLTLQARDAANSNPGNIKVENLINGKEYVITVNYDAPNKVAKVKIEGPSIDFPTLKLVDSDGNEYPLTREGTTYSYVWTPAKAGSMSFYVTNGYLYYDADGNVNTKKPDTEDYIKVSYEANKEYIVRIETAYDKDAKVKIETGINDKSILGRAGLVGSGFGWDGSTKLIKKDDTTYYYDFVASATDQTFSIQEKAGSWDNRWCGNLGEPSADGVWDKSKYMTFNAGDEKTLTYVVGGDPEHAHMTLLKDSKYRLTFTITGAKSVSAKLELLEKVEAQIIDLTGFEIAGDIAWVNNDTATGVNLVKNGDNYIYELKYANSMNGWGGGNGTLNFKVRTAGSWTTGYGSETVVKGTLSDGIDFKTPEGGNIQLTGLVDGTTYILTFTPSTSDITLSVAPKA
ncbi:MAG: hypothetical protein MR876_03650 [Treponema porcinum]|uniref:hypothetical protein n=1 Tax=Treponema porcinum TaxID=261392 RepID=UPI002352AE84|nr:hypothetical protein [Treponema porcinum]MCI6815644.1 hypothetical protein [Treponema porcinum]